LFLKKPRYFPRVIYYLKILLTLRHPIGFLIIWVQLKVKTLAHLRFLIFFQSINNFITKFILLQRFLIMFNLFRLLIYHNYFWCKRKMKAHSKTKLLYSMPGIVKLNLSFRYSQNLHQFFI